MRDRTGRRRCGQARASGAALRGRRRSARPRSQPDEVGLMRSMPFDDSDLPPEMRRLEDDYEFLRELGRGGTAVVYLARDRRTGQSVAVKVIDRPYVEDPD